MEKDYLDHLIELSKEEDPRFAEAWKEVETEIRLADIRKAAHLTQEQVAKRLGVARPRIAEIERHPYSVSLGKLRDYLHVLGADIRIVFPDKDAQKAS